MATEKREDKYAGAAEQAQAQYEDLREKVHALNKANDAAQPDEVNEDARRAIDEDPLSVMVRSPWHTPGDAEGMKPAEYEILLCTGGPAVRIVGDLSEHGEPITARLEMQDWFLPWTEYRPIDESDKTFASRIDTKAEETLLAYARCFWYGEG